MHVPTETGPVQSGMRASIIWVAGDVREPTREECAAQMGLTQLTRPIYATLHTAVTPE